MGLRAGLRLIRGMRRSLTEDEQHKVANTSNNHNFFVGSIVGAAPMILAHNLS